MSRRSRKAALRRDRQHQRGENPSARETLRKAQPAFDRIKPSMQRLVPVLWSWDEEFAKRVGTASKGYYKIDHLVRCHMLTPEEAEELVIHHNWWDGQRKMDGKHAERLSAEMVVMVDLSIALGPDNYPRIVNGQHNLWAMFLAGRPMQVTVTPYMCRDNEGMANLYSIFDSNKTRSAATVLDTYRKAGALDIQHTSSRHHKWAQCVVCAENDFYQPKRQQTNAARLKQAKRPEVLDFAKWIEDRIENVNQVKGLVPMGVGACIYAMYTSDVARADLFVRKYLSGAGLTEDDPILALRERMTIKKPPAEHGATASRIHAEIVYTCWRKFCLNEPLHALRSTRNLPPWHDWQIYVPTPDQEEKGLTLVAAVVQ